MLGLYSNVPYFRTVHVYVMWCISFPIRWLVFGVTDSKLGGVTTFRDSISSEAQDLK